jgi:UDP-N-acetylmuramate dehydrogenase
MNTASLQAFNTFGVEARCSSLIKIYSERDIYDTLITYSAPYKVIGGGSNILLAGDIEATVMLNQIKGIQVIDEDQNHVLVTIGGGENWHNLVLWSISHNLSGLQNLSLIPGSVGAAPIQNIGAYGVEQSDSFHSLRAISLITGLTKLFYKEDCKFGYRDSIFKKEEAGKYIITHVSYMLSKEVDIDVSYGAIRSELTNRKIEFPTLKQISDVICDIRISKLPDPLEVGNAGSFFKNPVVAIEVYEALLQRYPEIVAFPFGDQMKLSAGWLIDRAGWKGKSQNGAAVYQNHALVLINDGTSSGGDIWQLAMDIQDDVFAKYGVEILPEVNVWGSL